MLREIRDMGFEYAELSHGTRLALMPGILEAVDAGDIKISSLHNFCPLPMGVNHAAPNLYQFSAEKARERELAERYTLKTLEFAERVNAPVVVMHVGSMEMKNTGGRKTTQSSNLRSMPSAAPKVKNRKMLQRLIARE